METILISGINGFLGSSLAKSLSRDFNIIGLENSLDNLFRLKNNNFKIYNSEGNIEEIFQNEKIKIIIHTATIYRKMNEPVENLLNTNIILPTKLLELAQNYSVVAFINTDTFFNNSKFNYSYLGEYTLTKKHCLDWLKIINKNTKLINMRLFHMYGKNDSKLKFIPKLIDDLKGHLPEIKLTQGEQKRDFIYIADVVSAFTCVIKNIKNIKSNYTNIEVGSGSSIPIKRFVEIAHELTKSKSVLNFGALDYRNGEIMDSKANIQLLSNLGWQPHTNIYQGIHELL